VASLQRIDLSPAREFLLPDWGRRSLSGWVHHKFGLAIDPATWSDLDRAEIIRRVKVEARRLYAQKEAELPVRIAMMTYLGDRALGQATPRFDREGLAEWFSARYHAVVDADSLRPLLRPEIEALMLDQAHRHYRGAALAEELDSRLAAAGLAPTVDKAQDKNGAPPHPAALPELSPLARHEPEADLH